MAFPAGLIAQVDRDGNSTYQPPGEDLGQSDSCIQLTEDDGGRPPVKKKWWQKMCKCLAPTVPPEDPTFPASGGNNHNVASSEAVQTGWSGVNGHRNADGQDSDGSNETLMSDHQRAQQKPATGIMAGGGSPGYHFPGALLPTKRVPHKVTLILDLDETLVHSSFKPVPGADWVVPVEVDGTVHRVFVCKRPGLDIFMKRVAELFEVVVFTASLDKYANPVLDLLERNVPRSVHHRLFREHCVLTNGALVKDITRMGRDARKCIIVDNSPASYLLQPENAIGISSWFDSPHDQQLLLMLPWLQRLSREDDVLPLLNDMRQVMDSGDGNLQSPLDLSYADGSP